MDNANDRGWKDGIEKRYSRLSSENRGERNWEERNRGKERERKKEKEKEERPHADVPSVKATLNHLVSAPRYFSHFCISGVRYSVLQPGLFAILLFPSSISLSPRSHKFHRLRPRAWAHKTILMVIFTPSNFSLLFPNRNKSHLIKFS